KYFINDSTKLINKSNFILIFNPLNNSLCVKKPLPKNKNNIEDDLQKNTKKTFKPKNFYVKAYSNFIQLIITKTSFIRLFTVDLKILDKLYNSNKNLFSKFYKIKEILLLCTHFKNYIYYDELFDKLRQVKI